MLILYIVLGVLFLHFGRSITRHTLTTQKSPAVPRWHWSCSESETSHWWPSLPSLCWLDHPWRGKNANQNLSRNIKNLNLNTSQYYLHLPPFGKSKYTEHHWAIYPMLYRDTTEMIWVTKERSPVMVLRPLCCLLPRPVSPSHCLWFLVLPDYGFCRKQNLQCFVQSCVRCFIQSCEQLTYNNYTLTKMKALPEHSWMLACVLSQTRVQVDN